jgi:aminoglycoside 3-N-acetyltransferase
MLFLGAPIQSMTFVHYVEHLVGVPHLYSKLYSTPVIRDGEEIDLPVVAQVRYLHYDIEYDLSRFESDLREHGLIRSAAVGDGEILVVGFRETLEFLSKKLQRDCYYLLKGKPAFRVGEIPTDEHQSSG